MLNSRFAQKAALVFFFWMIFCPAYAAAAQLINGQAVSGSISVPGEQDTFTFDANAGDVITIRPITTDNQLLILFYLELYAPDGSEIASDFFYIDQALPASGRYTLILKEYFGKKTGSYSIVYATVSNNNWAPAIAYGQTVSGTISGVSRIKFYQFSGKANEVLSLTVTATSGFLFYPQIDLYSPNGAFMGEAEEQINKYLPLTGKYTILMYDKYDHTFPHTGTYKLTCVKKTDSAPIVGTLSPASGSSKANEQAAFTAVYSDADGSLDIKGAYFLVNASANTADGLYAYYDSDADKLYLRDDKNRDWLGGYAPGVPLVIENSFGKINCGDTEVSLTGNTMTINWAVSFKPLFAGRSYNMYLAVTDSYDANSGLIQKGGWRVDQQDGPIEITSFLPLEKSRFLEGATIPCSTQASPAEYAYLYQFVVDDQVKRDFAAQNSWSWPTTAQDRGAHTLTVKVKNEYGAVKEKSRRLIIYRRPIEPQ